MKKQRNFRTLFLGAATVLLAIWAANPVIAAVQQTISVLAGISISIDNIEQPSVDANGNSMEALIYNNVVYLPAQVVTTVSGKQVQWDQEAQRVYIGSHSAEISPMVYLSQLDYFTIEDAWRFDHITKDNLGNEHIHSMTASRSNGQNSKVAYKIDAQYNRLTAFYYQVYESRGSKREAVLIIYGDGVQLWKGTMNSSLEPIAIDIDITGVSNLTIEFPKGSNLTPRDVALGDVILWQ